MKFHGRHKNPDLRRGFAGVYTALYLDRHFAPSEDIQVTLVSDNNFLLFTPMLHEVAASDLDPTHIVIPLRRILKRDVVYQGT